jgi:hypothetical protein
MESLILDALASILSGDYWAAERQKAGMSVTPATAPRGVLNDTDTCVHLRRALRRKLGKGASDVSDKSELGFYYMGDYYAVLSRVRIPPGTEPEVRQRHPMHIFTKGKKPRLLLTIYV